LVMFGEVERSAMSLGANLPDGGQDRAPTSRIPACCQRLYRKLSRW